MMSSTPQKPTPRRTGLRREANIFLPVSTLALMVLSVVSMLSYRGALLTITEQERADVLADARQAASILPLGASTSSALGRALGPHTNGALLEANGSALVSAGDQPTGNLFAPMTQAPTEAMTAGPNEHTQARVVAWLPLRNGLVLRAHRLRPSLAAEWTRWRRLVIVITLAVGALGTLLLLYLRRLFAPIDNLLRTARRLESESFGEDGPSEEDDEIEYLVHRFESAMKALQEQRETARSTPLGEELEGQLATLQQTFSHLESGMALVDLDGTVLALNQVGAQILDLATAVLPAPMSSLLKTHNKLLSLLETAMSNQQPLRRQECAIRIGEQERDLGLTLSPLTRDDGTPRGWIVLFADLTDARQEAERERLSTSLDQLAELSAGLAHELRNSLASMQGYAALLQRADLPPTAAADTEELQREIGQLHRIVEDFLSFARPGTSRLERVDLLRLAHRVAGDPALGGAAVKVNATSALTPNTIDSVASIGAIDCTVQGDEQLLHRLLRNLLLNAVRAQRERTQKEAVAQEAVIVRITSQKTDAGRQIAVHIEDRGPGLSTAAEKALFVPFATDSEGGSGLGLAIARRIADLHGARLEICNREGQGVRASIWFRI